MNSGKEKPPAIIFFDGVCHLCNGFVDWMILRDKKRYFAFAPLQGQTAKKYLPGHHSLDLQSVVVLSENKLMLKSEAVLFCLSQLGLPWSWFAILQILPAFVLNSFYDLIAKYRYQIFGKDEVCRIPQPQERSYLWD